MSAPWLTILGVGEDGAAGLSTAARAALDAAEIVMGPPRHLALVPGGGGTRIAWPVPFRDGLPLLLAQRGRPTVALASGDPFWFGAGSVIARELDPGEWRALPGPSVFSLAAARLGWPLETVPCLGLHAAPLSRLRPHLAPGARLLATLRDGDAVAALLAYLDGAGFGDSRVTVLAALGGPRERIAAARDLPGARPPAGPVAAAIEVRGPGAALALVPGRAEAVFEHDGQITKSPVRALTLAALAPRPGERLWDIGGGSGAVAIEWLLAHPSLEATTVEIRPDRAGRIRRNAAALGQDRLSVVEGRAPEALSGLPRPDAIFVGGGLTAALIERLAQLAPGARLVSNAVTLETEALVLDAHRRLGGDLLRLRAERPQPVGRFHGWAAAYPLVQWSVTL